MYAQDGQEITPPSALPPTSSSGAASERAHGLARNSAREGASAPEHDLSRET